MAESQNSIREGFLCPMCHEDLHSSNNLLTHFQDLHSEEQDILKSLKDLVGKAKKKILKLNDQELESFKEEISLQQYHSVPQEPGRTQSHTEYFKDVRRNRLDHRISETNKLVIRLDKLLRVEGSDRKQREQDLVAWLDGATVTRCPSCTVTFNIARRQHHCRLCGCIMCNNCSCFLSFDTAKTIVAPIYTEANKSTPNAKSESESLRICEHCMNMLENRRYNQMCQVVKPPICKLYKQLQKIKNELQPSVDLYVKIYDSLAVGDTTFDLQDAQSLKSSIAKQGEALDTISKHILEIPLDPEQPKALVLQTAVRRATSQYIKDCLLTLPTLPSPAELNRIQEKRAMRNYEDNYPSRVMNIRKVAVATGWSPNSVSKEVVPEISSNDPLLEQINIVKNYIEQARNAHRFEEVASLQENLSLLEQAYGMQLHEASTKNAS